MLVLVLVGRTIYDFKNLRRAESSRQMPTARALPREKGTPLVP